MKLRNILLTITCTFSFLGFAQAQGEYDDMYFNSSDRKKIKAQKIMEREKLFSGINQAPLDDKSLTENYSERNVDPALIARYKKQSLVADSLGTMNPSASTKHSDYNALYSAADYVMSENNYQQYANKKVIKRRRRFRNNSNFSFGFMSSPWGWAAGPSMSWGFGWGSPFRTFGYSPYDPWNNWGGAWGSPWYGDYAFHNPYWGFNRWGWNSGFGYWPNHYYGGGNIIVVTPENRRRVQRGAAPNRGSARHGFRASSGRNQETRRTSQNRNRYESGRVPGHTYRRSDAYSRDHTQTQNEYYRRSTSDNARRSRPSTSGRSVNSRSSRSNYSSRTAPGVSKPKSYSRSNSESRSSGQYKRPASRTYNRSNSSSGFNNRSSYQRSNSPSRSSYSRSSSGSSRSSSYSRSSSGGRSSSGSRSRRP